MAGTGLGSYRAVTVSNRGYREDDSENLVRPNPNLLRAGMLRDGTLTVALEARESPWRLNGRRRAAMTIEAFAEPGKAPLMPGPLVRTMRGTPIRFSVRNALPLPLTFIVPAAVRGGPDRIDAMDSVVIAPGAVGELSTRAAVPGNYIYRATTPTIASRREALAGVLAGALVVDSAGTTRLPNDRVFVIMETPDSMHVAHESPTGPPAADTLGRFIYTINGRSWPNTDRISATVGDSLHWRVINASSDTHPMHLHGFYYRVDALTGPLVGTKGQGFAGQHVVTELLWPLSSMSMSWSPDRPGNWLFHCHFAVHLHPDSLSAAPDDPHLRGMAGLVLGVMVADRPGAHVARMRQSGSPTATRQLHLIAVEDSGELDSRFPNAVPSMHFVIVEHGRRTEARPGLSPELDLVRGEPVAITIVNHLDEPTTVHWHGIEVADSYVDGVAGFSGAGRRLTPEIAPGDSFVARFTPPRSGTFMYHTHMDDVREERAGLEGALVVRDPGVAPSSDDHVIFLKGSRRGDISHPLEINGEANPDTVVLRVGQRARLRILSLAWTNPNPVVALTARPDSARNGLRDTLLARWTPLAKDGLDLPASARMQRPARQVISMGETYDFEFTPARIGTLRLEVRGDPPFAIGVPSGRLLARVPIRVE
jgi:FtsP/CotA-like multicopper oxidase with cupredoxin domain